MIWTQASRMLTAAALTATGAGLLSGCPIVVDDTPTNTPVFTPTPTAVDTPTAISDTHTPTATATPTEATVTPTPTQPGVPTPTVPLDPCLAPSAEDAVCLDVGEAVYLVDGIVVEPQQGATVPGVPTATAPLVGLVVAEFRGFEKVNLNEATITNEAGDPQPAPLSSLATSVNGEASVVDNGDGTLSILPIDPDQPFGLNIDTSTVTALGTGWSLGRDGGAIPGFYEHFDFFDATGGPIGSEEINASAEGIFYSASWEAIYGEVCEVRLYLAGELVTSLTESCQGIQYEILDKAEDQRVGPSGGDPLPPLGMQDFDIAESQGKIRYTFTGSSTYDFDLP